LKVFFNLVFVYHVPEEILSGDFTYTGRFFVCSMVCSDCRIISLFHVSPQSELWRTYTVHFTWNCWEVGRKKWQWSQTGAIERAMSAV